MLRLGPALESNHHRPYGKFRSFPEQSRNGALFLDFPFNDNVLSADGFLL